MATEQQLGGATAHSSHRNAADLLLEQNTFPGATRDELAHVVAAAREEWLKSETVICSQDGLMDDLAIVLEGTVRISRTLPGGQEVFVKKESAPIFVGEASLLSNMLMYMTVRTVSPARVLRIGKDAFWTLMSAAPHFRASVLSEMRIRMRGLNAFETQQQKLALLGTMTAGLMHELHNPGSAARRAAQQLRQNLQRMHTLARSFSERGHTADQRACLSALQERVLESGGAVCMSSLQQSDAEEALGEWMEAQSVPDAWKLAPTLVGSGIRPADLDCLAHVFAAPELPEPIQWLEATASSMQMVALVEESVARVTELAQSVKAYAHEGQGGLQAINVNESVHGTLVLLKHKFREKGIHLEKQFGAGIPNVTCMCAGLNQIWTNLLDNAVDAVAPGGHIQVRTWHANGEVHVAIHDDGPGISQEQQERIFDPFYTTKPVGVGTGLGLGIVKKLLETNGGRLTLASQPGATEFVVHLPAEPAEA